MKEKIEEIKELSKKRDISLFGFHTNGGFSDLSYKIQKLISYLYDGSVGFYQLKDGWLFVKSSPWLNESKVKQLKFKPYTTKTGEKGFIKKIFNNENQFIFKIKN